MNPTKVWSVFSDELQSHHVGVRQALNFIYHVKVIWSTWYKVKSFERISHPLDFHPKAYYVGIVTIILKCSSCICKICKLKHDYNLCVLHSADIAVNTAPHMLNFDKYEHLLQHHPNDSGSFQHRWCLASTAFIL